MATHKAIKISKKVYFKSFLMFLTKTVCPTRYRLGISSVILTPMKILQRNLNRGTFVVWEMKRNVSVVCVCSAPNCCDMEQQSANQPGSVASGTPCINTNLHQEHHLLCPVKIRAWCPNTMQSWTNTNRATATRKWMMCIHTIMTWKVNESCQ
jgi:hypothetical protein